MIEPACPHCNTPLIDENLFCGNCGQKITMKSTAKMTRSLQIIIAFYISYLVYSVISFMIYMEDDSLRSEIVLESIFILLTLGFTLLDAKAVFSLYRFKEVDWKGLLFSLMFPVATAVVVYYGVGALNIFLFDVDDNVFDGYLFEENPFFWVFLFYVIVAPVFEELAFRGFLFNQMRQIASVQVTIIGTAFIFALIHFSWVSMLWIFPFGIVLGYLRHKYNTLWLGMIVHFIHNLLVVMLDYYAENNMLFLVS